jgi:hypothetical protein
MPTNKPKLVGLLPTSAGPTSPEVLNTVKIGRNAVKGKLTHLGVLKSFPGHKGIPGNQGGSLPNKELRLSKKLTGKLNPMPKP